MRSFIFQLLILLSLLGCGVDVGQIQLTPNLPRKIRIEDLPVNQRDYRFTKFEVRLNPEVSGADTYDLKIEAHAVATRERALFGLQGWTSTEPGEPNDPGGFYTRSGLSSGTVVGAWIGQRLLAPSRS